MAAAGILVLTFLTCWESEKRPLDAAAPAAPGGTTKRGEELQRGKAVRSNLAQPPAHTCHALPPIRQEPQPHGGARSRCIACAAPTHGRRPARTPCTRCTCNQASVGGRILAPSFTRTHPRVQSSEGPRRTCAQCHATATPAARCTRRTPYSALAPSFM